MGSESSRWPFQRVGAGADRLSRNIRSTAVNRAELIESTASNLGVLVHKWRRNRQDYGWRVALTKTLAHLLRPVYFRQVYRLYRISLLTHSLPTGPPNSDFYFRIIEADDAEAIAQIEDVAEWLRGELKGRLAAGQLCLAAFYGDKVVAFNLVGFGHIFMPLVNLEKRLRPGTAWSEHIAVRKDFRRMRLASQLRYRLFDELRKRGIRRLYAGTLPSNLASTKMQESVGLKAIVDVHYRRMLLFETWQYKRVRQ